MSPPPQCLQVSFLSLAAAIGGAVIPQVKGVFDRVKGAVKRGANVRGGRVGRRSAPS